ncbi:hypothetical protein [Mycobacterium sp.]|uniref:Rv3212 family protein n=1 Tax=Mycobacterium sp. TaxID=1785 RepID=UPI003A89E569
MVQPERRTRADILAATAITAAVAAIAALIWWNSDARATTSRPATTPAANPPTAAHVPAALKQLWSAPSPTTRVPVAVGGTVVTGDRHRVDGRDRVTGQALWSYSRGSDLCGVSWVHQYAVAVYRDDRGCGQVSTIDGSTGRRGPTRSSYADAAVQLSANGATVLSAGATRLEMWRSDLVRMIVYGETDARVKPPARGLHSGCTLESAAASSTQVSVLESCADQADLRLLLLHPGKDDDEPKQQVVPQPGVPRGAGARVLAVSQERTAVYLPGPQPRVEVIDDTGTTVSSTALAGQPSHSAAVSRAGDLVTWWTGNSLMVFDAAGLTLRYTIAAGETTQPLGPATMMAGQLLVPVTDAIGVYDPASGEAVRYLEVQRQPVDAPVVPAVVGSQVIEQRGDTMVALG